MMSKDGDKLAYGLNSRNSSNSKKKKKKVGGLAGFDGGSTGSSDDDDVDEPNDNDDNGLSVKRRTASSTNSGRDAVNRAIVAEQAALRHRVGAAAAAAADGVDYDYDAEYDSFSTTATNKTNSDTGDNNTATTKEKAKPRYITSLLQTAQRRNREHEVVHERKVIHEQQQEEDENGEYEGKERIITNSYKRKLEEREHWAREEAERTRQEELRDEQLKESCNKGGYMTNSLMLGIVGRNLLTMNNKNNEQQRTTTIDRDLGVRREGEEEKVSFLTDKRNNSGSNSSYRPVTQLQTQTAAYVSSSSSVPDIARAAINGPLVQQTKRGNTANSVTSTLEVETAAATTTTTTNNQKSRQEILEERAIKIYNARKRYFERREKEKRLGVR